MDFASDLVLVVYDASQVNLGIISNPARPGMFGIPNGTNESDHGR